MVSAVEMHANEAGRSQKRISSKQGPAALLGQTWRFLLIGEIDNFSALRRHVGRERAARLADDVARRICDVLPDARLTVISRHSVEVAFEHDDRDQLEIVLDRLQTAFQQPANLEHEGYHLEMLFGAAAVRAIACDEVLLAENAESALTAERARKVSASSGVPQPPPTLDRTALSRELPQALAEGQLFLVYQPKVHLRRQEVVGIEALVRWEHPTRGLILPTDFIPSAENTRHIGPLTLWTLKRAIADQRRLAARGHDLPIYLNVSGVLLSDDPFVAEACSLVAASDAKMGFEITETAVIRDPDSAIANLHRFADIGISIAIDDYGAGLSSLAYLKQLPASELKIDKLFVTQLSSSHRDPLIVRSTIDLAHALEMEVTAEGVETEAALALLTVMGCDMAQGFLISRPVMFDALVCFLEEGLQQITSDPRAMFARFGVGGMRA